MNLPLASGLRAAFADHAIMKYVALVKITLHLYGEKIQQK